MFQKGEGSGREKQQRIKLHETTAENDIRFLGPLTSQHFKILGWLCIVVAQVILFIRLGGRLNAGFAEASGTWLGLLGYVADLALPFLLIATFTQLLNAEGGYWRQILINAAAMAGICAAWYIGFYRYIVGSLGSLLTDPSEALPTVQGILRFATPYGFLAFNIFVDLFLCALTMFFLNYRPRRIFTGKTRIFFRLLALLPVAYEVGCMLLKLRSARGMITVPLWAYPLLTVKPPMTFVLFVALAMFVKTRELRFRRHGKTHEEYREFLKTRRNSRNFSLFLAGMMVLVGIVDFVAVMGFSVNEMARSISTNVDVALLEAEYSENQAEPESLEEALTGLGGQLESQIAGTEAAPDAEPAAADSDGAAVGDAAMPERRELTEEEREAAINTGIERATEEEILSASVESGIRLSKAVGFGDSICLILLAPLVLLFSYTRKPKSRLLDMLIPVAGIALILIVYLEGIHRLLGILPIQKLNIQELRDALEYSLTVFLSAGAPIG